MAVTNKVSNQFVLESLKGEHNFSSHSFKACLMDDAFVFNPATHSTYAEISSDEIATGYGYTQKTKAITISSVALDGNNALISCDSPVWTATGGAIPATAACCIINDSHTNDTVVCCCEFGVAYATAEDKQFQINFSNGLAEGIPNPA